MDEMIVITNYRCRIEQTIRLLTSWVREVPERRSGESEGGLRRITPPAGLYMGGLEKPIAGSTLLPEFQPLMLAIMDEMGINLNYRIDRIPKTMPLVLAELNLEGLHHYLATDEEFSYQQSMEMVAFMDKVIWESDFSEDEWGVDPGEKRIMYQITLKLGTFSEHILL